MLLAAKEANLACVLADNFSEDDIVDFLTALLKDTGVKVSGPVIDKPEPDDENPAADL